MKNSDIPNLMALMKAILLPNHFWILKYVLRARKPQEIEFGVYGNSIKLYIDGRLAYNSPYWPYLLRRRYLKDLG